MIRIRLSTMKGALLRRNVVRPGMWSEPKKTWVPPGKIWKRAKAKVMRVISPLKRMSTGGVELLLWTKSKKIWAPTTSMKKKVKNQASRGEE